MKKEEVIELSERYSKNKSAQTGYIVGFQAACNIIREKMQYSHNIEFCDEIESLSEVAYMDFSDYIF